MFRISKKLQECFKQISLFASLFTVKSAKYRDQYLTEFKRLTGKQQRDRKRRQKMKQRQQKQRIRQEIQKQRKKQRYGDKEPNQNQNRQRDRSDRHEKERDRSDRYEKERDRQKSRDERRERYRELNKDKQNKQKPKHRVLNYENDKQKQKYREKDRNQKYKQRQIEKQKITKKVSQLQIERELDFQKDLDIKYAEKPAKNQVIFQQSEPEDIVLNTKQDVKGKTQRSIKPPEPIIRWSKRKLEDSIGSKDPEKYKILRIDQPASDYEDEDAVVKVPEIVPRSPLTPYFLFLRKNRSYISQSFPELNKSGNFGDIWKKLSQEQKKPYIEQYQRAYSLYTKKCQQYRAVNPQGAIQNDKRQRIKHKKR